MLGMLNRLHQQQEAVHAYGQGKTVHPKLQQDLLSDLEVDKRSFFFQKSNKDIEKYRSVKECENKTHTSEIIFRTLFGKTIALIVRQTEQTLNVRKEFLYKLNVVKQVSKDFRAPVHI